MIEQLLNAFIVGSNYALLALGYTLVFGILRLLNFAHGELFMFGAFVGYFAYRLTGGSLILMFIGGLAAAALIGIAMERIAFRPLSNTNELSLLMASIALQIILADGAILLFGPEIRRFPEVLPTFKLGLGPITITGQQFVLVLVLTAFLTMMQIILYRSRLGIAVRAASADRETTSLMGLNVNTLIAATVAVASVLAAAAGMLSAMYYHAIFPAMGTQAGLKAFIAAVVGGIGSIPGAAVGGLLLGLVESFATAYISSMWRDGIAFALLVVVLLARPGGLFASQKGDRV